MRAGDLFFSAGTHVAGIAIRTWDWTRYNHVGVVLDESGRIAEAVGGGFSYGQIRPGSVVCSPPLTDEQRSMVEPVVKGMIGIPYGYLDVLSLGLAQIGLRQAWVKRRIEDPTTLFCSQAADEVLRRVGFRAFDDGRWSHSVTPGDLQDLAFRQNWHTTVI